MISRTPNVRATVPNNKIDVKVVSTPWLHLREFIQQCRDRDPTLRYLLVGGDLTRKPSWSEDWATAKNASIAEACQLFSELDLKTYFVLGNDDIENPPIANLHGQNFLGMTNQVIPLENGIGLLGFSYVPPTPFRTRYERDEKTLKQMLEPLFRDLNGFKFRVVMCHARHMERILTLRGTGIRGVERFKFMSGVSRLES